MFDWLKSKTRERRKKVRLDRKHVEERARRFLQTYLDADEMRKPHFYRAVQDISNMCRPAELIGRSDVDDGRVAEITSQAAMKMVLGRTGGIKESDSVANFVTDACATVAVAYNRAAGVYVGDEELQELGTAAVHLLTMATSYMTSHENDGEHGGSIKGSNH
jgi:hypothetical protein